MKGAVRNVKAIEVKHISKNYRGISALCDVSFSFQFGKIYGFLGRNGAGKSTLINIISNRIFADSGEVLIDGIPAKENMAIQNMLFCMSETDLYDRDLKVKEHFGWTARFYDGFDTEMALRLAERFGLDPDKRFRALSKGYQSIFKLIVALSQDVPYVIFDEPILGLDASHRELFYRLLLERFEEKERTYIIATHLIEEVSGLIEEVIFLDHGKVIVQESVEELLRKGYSVSGPAEEVDLCCRGKNLVGCDVLGGLKTAYVLGERPVLPDGSRLVIGAVPLQKLFIKMTE